YSDYYQAVVTHAIPEHDEAEPPMGLLDDYRFTREYTDRPIKFSMTGPFSLSRRVKNEYYKDDADLVMAFARLLNREARALAEAGVAVLQVEEPLLGGCADHANLAVNAL